MVTATGFEGIELVGVDDSPSDGTVGTVDGALGTVNGKGVVMTAGSDSGSESGRFEGRVGKVGNDGTVYSLLVDFSANLFSHMPFPTVFLTSVSS